MVLPEPGDRRDAVDERHVEVDHDRVWRKLVGELDRVETVCRGADDHELRLMLDEWDEGLEERLLVVRQQHADGGIGSAFGPAHQGSDVSLAAVSVQPAGRRVALIGAPLDLGSGRRGVDMGPSAIRYAELAEHLAAKLGIETNDLGNVEAPVAESVASG